MDDLETVLSQRESELAAMPDAPPRYAICFDLPDLEGTPVFAKDFGGEALPNFTSILRWATTWADEVDAERYLLEYPKRTARYGCVVEVEA